MKIATVYIVYIRVRLESPKLYTVYETQYRKLDTVYETQYRKLDTDHETQYWKLDTVYETQYWKLDRVYETQYRKLDTVYETQYRKPSFMNGVRHFCRYRNNNLFGFFILSCVSRSLNQNLHKWSDPIKETLSRILSLIFGSVQTVKQDSTQNESSPSSRIDLPSYLPLGYPQSSLQYALSDIPRTSLTAGGRVCISNLKLNDALYTQKFWLYVNTRKHLCNLIFHPIQNIYPNKKLIRKIYIWRVLKLRHTGL